MRRFELRDDKSSKFWEVSSEGSAITVRFGKIGTNGQTQTKSHATPKKAETELEKLVREKTAKGYVEIVVAPAKAEAVSAPPEAEPAPAKTPKAKAIAAAPAEDGWLEAANGYRVALVDGKIVAQNPKGQKLASVPKELREHEVVEMLGEVKELLATHAAECLATAERWMLRSLPVPASVVHSVWPDPAWRGALENLVVVPVDAAGARDDEAAGFLRGVDAARGIGLVTVDGETVWTKAAALALPHPILLPTLDDFRALALELGATQGLAQLLRETYPKPRDLAANATAVRDFVGGEFEQLNHALGLCRRLGYRVSGGSAVTRVWENGKVVEARLWIGAESPESPTELDELSWVDEEERPLALAAVSAVAFSEGVRMGTRIFAGRKLPKEGADV